MNTNTYTFKTNTNKYANLHACDQKYWKFSCDFSQPQDKETIAKAIEDTDKLLDRIMKSKDFKPENVEAAKQLHKIFHDGMTGRIWATDVHTFLAYQYQRYAFRIWYRDTKAARDAASKEAAPAKKAPAKKAPAKQEKKAPAKKAPAKQDIAKANEATFVSKLTKAQKKELVLTLLAELIK